MMKLKTYRTSRNERGNLVIHDVPIFCVCERGPHSFDHDWVMEAFRYGRERAAKGYGSPLHLRHNDGLGGDVVGLGYFVPTRTGMVSVEGETRLGIFADLTVTNREQETKVLEDQFPWRSVEIYNPSKAKLSGLALLDHEAPYLDLPMMMIDRGGVEGSTPYERDTAALATGDTFLEVFSGGPTGGVAILFKGETSMADEEKKDDDYDEEDRVDMMAEEGANETIEAFIAAIKDGTIPLKYFDQLREIMAEREGGEAVEDEMVEDEVIAEAEAPAQMSGRGTAREAQLQAKVDKLEARLNKREEAESIARDVDAAMALFSGRPAGDLAALKAKLVERRKTLGKHFEVYVQDLTNSHDDSAVFFSEESGFGSDRPARSTSAVRMSAAVQQYAKSGPKVLEAAVRHSADWQELSRAGSRLDEASYIRISLKDEGLING